MCGRLSGRWVPPSPKRGGGKADGATHHHITAVEGLER